ncbi:MAG: hypothetical protein O3A28_01010 [Actinomycetota bacterium]|nr:hypothetical protein [Actinomycetota bacterium]MDA3006378.1 hypothetical protein [Actinomycetota bacterium]MDA3033592.1 hypothetical protein [Actinomycetota bacterium]
MSGRGDAADIITLVAACDRGAAEARAWSDVMATAATTAAASPRLCITATHRLDEIAALWAARRPGVPLDEPSDTTEPQPGNDVIAALCSWIDAELARVADLVAGIDARVDPSTVDTARRLNSELTDLRDRCRSAA